MKKHILTLLPLFLLACAKDAPKEIALPPEPATPVKLVTEKLYGQEVTDGYRYLEDLKNEENLKWYREHEKRSRMVLNAIAGREAMIKKMFELDARRGEKFSSLSILDNDMYFYLKETPEDETGKLFFRQGFEGKEEMLFDPQVYQPNSKQKYVISSFYPSPTGKKIAINVSPNGSENSDLIIMDVQAKTFYPEKIDRIWFANCSWNDDESSFYYSRMRSNDVHDKNREKNGQVFLHTVGKAPEQDKEVLSKAHDPQLEIKEEEIPALFLDPDSKHAFAFSFSVDNRIKSWVAGKDELKKGKPNWRKFTNSADEIYAFETNEKDAFMLSPKNAPQFKILKASIESHDMSKATVFVPEFPDRTITGMTLTKDALYFSTTKNGVEASVYRADLATGKFEPIELPFKAGSAFLSSKGARYPDVWISLSGWTQPSQRFRFVPETKEFKKEMLSKDVSYPEYKDLVVEEISVTSHDGVKVPLSIVYDKKIKKDGNNPVWMLGYGSYGISINPFFSPSYLLWTANGGIVAVAHVRGGGELGDGWHKAGFKTSKPNTWKDLIACAEFMVENKYTSPKKIVINGGSAGGILIGRAMTERPDLFVAAIPEVGSLNPLRAEESPNGPVNVPEFGTVKDSVECMALIEMDAYLHIKDGEKYPATLVTAGMNDPRVIAWEPAKFAARLAAATKSGKPVLFLPDFEAGHGIGDSKTKQFESLADIFSFGFWQTGHPDFQISQMPVMGQEQPEKELKVE